MKTPAKTRPAISTGGWFLFLLFGAALYRVIRAEWAPHSLPNFSPIMSIAICGALYLPLPRLAAVVAPISALVISDVLLNIHYGVAWFNGATFLALGCYVLAAMAGLSLRRWKTVIPAVLGAALVSSILFYLVTNTASWWGNPAYPQTAFGWAQALTVGLPGYPPTWMFFRNSLTSDLLFTLGFSLLAIAAARRENSDRFQVAA